MTSDAWYLREPDDVLARLGVTADGLSSLEASRRLATHGPNQLTRARRVRPLRIFLRQFASLMIWILVVAGILSGFLGEIVDAAAIFAIVGLNALVGFYQEYRAERSIAALEKLTAPKATVRRDGAMATIPAIEIVVGDVLALAAGDLVAADARLLESHSLTCVESALTGEAEAVAKQTAALAGATEGDIPLGDRDNLVFSGTSVATGTGRAVVVATAMATELGRIAGLLAETAAARKTPLQQKLDAFGRILVSATLAVVALHFGLGLWRETPPFELFLTSVSLAVAAVPEGLPAVVTVALALGVSRLARRGALVRKLAAVETLGSTNVICTDKTGTLTVGEMTARALYVAGAAYEITGEGYGPGGEVRFAGRDVRSLDVQTYERTHQAPLSALAEILLGDNQAQRVEKEGTWRTIGDPTEGALLTAGLKAGGDRARLEAELPRVRDFPFDSDRKRSSVVRRASPAPGEHRLRAFVNGAPGALLAVSTHLLTADGVRALTAEDRERWLAETARMAKGALRVLASATRVLSAEESSADLDRLSADEVERDLIFVGLTGIYDPPRPAAKAAIAQCRAAGIRVVMITGDHALTADAIARELGIDSASPALSGSELDKLDDSELARRVLEVAVYARVTAEHKLRIVRALNGHGDVVAMTGDGVNDAPAIQGADIGIAMGRTGTEVTKQAADMILTHDDFATLVAAVQEGRGIHDNIKKTLQYLLAGNTGELLLMTVAVAAGLPSPLFPIHLLWINLVTDGLPALCLATDAIDSDVISRPPRPRSQRLADRAFLATLLLTGFLTAGVALGVYLYALKTRTVEIARAAAFTVLVFSELLRSFGARSETKPVWRISLATNLQLVAVVALSFGLQIASQHNAMLGRFLKTSSLPLPDTLLLLALGTIPLAVLELVKLARKAASSP